MARFGRGFPVPKSRANVAILAPVITAASASLSAAFAGASSGVITEVPAAGTLTAAFSASATPTVRVSALGSVTATFSGAGSVGLALPTSNVSATFSGAFASPTILFPVSGAVSATFTGELVSPSVTTYVNAAVAATFAGWFSPEGLGATAALNATFAGASSGIVAYLATSGSLVATFTGASATGTPVVHLYSTQGGNQYVTDITSYGLHANVRIYVTVGVPTVSLGNDGDFALRKDATNGSGTQMYHRASGAWSAVA
jgi:hypothetical protein